MESFVNPTSTLTITPLMRSIYVNGARVIDKLLELGVDINSQVEANGNLTGIYFFGFLANFNSFARDSDLK